MLKPQDTLIALKLWADYQQQLVMPLREAASLVGISVSEFSKGLQRLEVAKLVVARDGRRFVERGALLEWLCYGVRYAYPVEQIGFGRGVATAWNCSLVTSDILPPTPAMVWQQPKGTIEGVMIAPIHVSAPLAASNNELMYQALALIDAVRLGKPRELAIARELLTKLIKGSL